MARVSLADWDLAFQRAYVRYVRTTGRDFLGEGVDMPRRTELTDVIKACQAYTYADYKVDEACKSGTVLQMEEAINERLTACRRFIDAILRYADETMKFTGDDSQNAKLSEVPEVK